MYKAKFLNESIDLKNNTSLVDAIRKIFVEENILKIRLIGKNIISVDIIEDFNIDNLLGDVYKIELNYYDDGTFSFFKEMGMIEFMKE